MSPDDVTQQVRLWDKDATDIQIVSTGATNIVGLAGSTVYRFPLDEEALSIQLYEAELYKELDGNLNLPVPQFVRIYEDPECIVLTRLEGKHLSVAELVSLSAQSLRNVIRQLLQFSITLNKTVSPEAITKLESSYIARRLKDRSWLDYFSRQLKSARFPEQPWLENLAHKQYAEWLNAVNSSSLPRIVVHDDLNDQNILFMGHRISGILDFGDCTTGTIAQEIRQLRRLGEEAVRVAIDEYAGMTGIAISLDEVLVWAVTQELAAYCRWTAKRDFARPSFIRSQANLRQWLNDFQG